MHGLVQQLADLGADAEGREHRPVPRLANDLGLPDQLRVVVADLVRSASTAPSSELMQKAVASVDATALLL